MGDKLIQYMSEVIASSGGIENYTDIILYENAEYFSADQVADAHARLMRNGIAIRQIDKDRLKAFHKISSNKHYKQFSVDEIIYTIQNARILYPEAIAEKLKKNRCSVEKIVRKIKELTY